jgi:predicted DNA-binding transcriptional regulator YafY
MMEEIKFIYTNWRGENSQRRAVPTRLWFGVSKYHKKPQWFIEAFDLDKNATRDFALVDMVFHEKTD